MKQGYILKNAKINKLNSDELSLINNYTRRQYSEDELYAFSVVLCDNEVDRDYECFTKDALDELAKLFVGKTGIFDHSMETKNQTARIFSCYVEQKPDSLNSLGEPYFRLVARAYLPIIDKNKDFIAEIDSGIKKEVSVSCGIKKHTCSICGNDVIKNPCNHSKGSFYGDDNNKKLCYVILDQPTDAYEWSFVAVPAQRGAGVIKSYQSITDQNLGINALIDKLDSDSEVTLNSIQAKNLYDFVQDLKNLSNDGLAYRDQLRNDVVKLGLRIFPQLKSKVLNDVCNSMSVAQLKDFKLGFLSKINDSDSEKPQLSSQRPTKQFNNVQFKI